MKTHLEIDKSHLGQVCKFLESENIAYDNIDVTSAFYKYQIDYYIRCHKKETIKKVYDRIPLPISWEEYIATASDVILEELICDEDLTTTVINAVDEAFRCASEYNNHDILVHYRDQIRPQTCTGMLFGPELHTDVRYWRLIHNFMLENREQTEIHRRETQKDIPIETYENIILHEIYSFLIFDDELQNMNDAALLENIDALYWIAVNKAELMANVKNDKKTT